MSSHQVKTLRKQLTDKRKQGEMIYCALCNVPITGFISIDHAVPLALGGSHRRDNLQPSHSKCNWKKADKVKHDE